MEQNGSRILNASGRPTDIHGRILKHNATIEEVYQIVAEETTKVHEYYLTQIPAFVARMIQDALVSYGLIPEPPNAEQATAPATAEPEKSEETRESIAGSSDARDSTAPVAVEGCVSPTTQVDTAPSASEGAESEGEMKP